jgi:hypothetical protein
LSFFQVLLYISEGRKGVSSNLQGKKVCQITIICVVDHQRRNRYQNIVKRRPIKPVNMQIKFPKIISAIALLLASATPAMSGPLGANTIKARAHKNVARSFNNSIEKRVDNAPGTYYNILMGETACGGYFQPSDFVRFCPLFSLSTLF